MSSGISEILSNKQLPIDRSGAMLGKQIPIDAVDRLADELIAEYSNPKFRAWYCKVIYKCGVEQVLEWRRRASEGNEPAKLFSKYAKETMTLKGPRSDQDG